MSSNKPVKANDLATEVGVLASYYAMQRHGKGGGRIGKFIDGQQEAVRDLLKKETPAPSIVPVHVPPEETAVIDTSMTVREIDRNVQSKERAALGAYALLENTSFKAIN